MTTTEPASAQDAPSGPLVHIADLGPEDVPECTLVRLLAFRSGGGDIYRLINPPRLVRDDVPDLERIRPWTARVHKELLETETYMRKATLAADGKTVVGTAFWRRHEAEEVSGSSKPDVDSIRGPPTDDTFDPEVDYEAQDLYKDATARTDELIMGGRLYWHLFRVVVHPDHQGRGIGKQLIQDGLQRIEARDPSAPVLLHAERAGIKMYTSFGFRVVKEDKVVRLVDGDGFASPTVYRWPTMVLSQTSRREGEQTLETSQERTGEPVSLEQSRCAAMSTPAPIGSCTILNLDHFTCECCNCPTQEPEAFRVHD